MPGNLVIEKFYEMIGEYDTSTSSDVAGRDPTQFSAEILDKVTERLVDTLASILSDKISACRGSAYLLQSMSNESTRVATADSMWNDFWKEAVVGHHSGGIIYRDLGNVFDMYILFEKLKKNNNNNIN